MAATFPVAPAPALSAVQIAESALLSPGPPHLPFDLALDSVLSSTGALAAPPGLPPPPGLDVAVTASRVVPWQGDELYEATTSALRAAAAAAVANTGGADAAPRSSHRDAGAPMSMEASHEFLPAQSAVHHAPPGVWAPSAPRVWAPPRQRSKAPPSSASTCSGVASPLLDVPGTARLTPSSQVSARSSSLSAGSETPRERLASPLRTRSPREESLQAEGAEMGLNALVPEGEAMNSVGGDYNMKKLQSLVWLQLQCSKDKDKDAAEVPVEALSCGSVGHPTACAVPCKFFATKRGCKDGMACSHCHACHWRSCLRRTRRRNARSGNGNGETHPEAA